MAEAAAAPGKRDLKREFGSLYKAAQAPVTIDVPALQFLMVDGQGDPNTAPAYAAAIEALFGVSYALKFMSKKAARPVDYAVMPLEGLWWADDMDVFLSGDRTAWKWTAMIMQPHFIGRDMVAEAIAATAKKKPGPALDRLRFDAFREGRAAQLMHIGPYNAEGPNIARLHAYIAEQGGSLSGKHHEIYLSDARRTPPEKLKTIIRQPFKD